MATRLTRPLARFAVIGSLVTAIDVAIVVAFAHQNLALVDVVAVLTATVASFVLHQTVTFRAEPYREWLRRVRAFVTASVAGLVIDVGVLLALAGTSPSRGRVAIAKVVAVAVAGTARWILHRRVLFSIVQAGRVPHPDRRPAPGDVRFSVVVPAFGEADRIAATIAAIRRALVDVDGGVEVVVVDDGSTDGTADAARAGGADVVLEHAHNLGKGAAVRTGVLRASGRTIAFTDADLAYAPEQLRELLREVEAGWDVVVGSRKHENTSTLVRARRLREIGGRVINWLTYSVLLGHYRDTQCGEKAFRSDVAREVFARAHIDRFAFDIELFVIAERNGLAIKEVPVTVTNATRSTVHVARDALRLVRDLFRIRRRAREGAYQLGEPLAARH